MIHFNELYIKDGHLIIDVSVLNESYYENVYLDSIVIDNQNSYSANGPSDEPVYSYIVPDVTTKLTKQTYQQKHIRLELDSSDVNLRDMLFVYVRTKGAPSPETPCGLDDSVTLGAVVDMLPYYMNGMQYMKQLSNSCEIPQGFTDMILREKALELCMRVGNYTKAIEYFNEMPSSVPAKMGGGCNCGHN